MSDYTDIYKKRLNRFGYDYQSRVQGQREKEFEDYLLKSVYRLNFEFDGKCHPGTLEPYKQDENGVVAYLLTRVRLDIPSGTVLMLTDKDRALRPWMIWWLENMKASGYNRYVVLRMDTEIAWDDQKQWSYFKGPGKSTIQDTVRSKTGQAYYTEDENLYMFITPFNDKLKKEQYLELEVGGVKQSFVVSGIDMLSTVGVMYVSIDPVHIRDNTPAPEKKPGDDDAAFYWLNGGDT